MLPRHRAKAIVERRQRFTAETIADALASSSTLSQAID
jgi:hypothetical protein